MFSLRINKTQIPLSKDFALGFNFLTNVLNISESIDPSFTLPIEVVNNEVVSELIGYAQDPQSDFDLSQVFDDCAIMLDGNDYWKGAIDIATANEYNVKFNFRYASGYIPTVNQKLKLRELFEDVNLNFTSVKTTQVDSVTTNLATETYRLSINGTVYTGEVDEFGGPYTYVDYLEDLALQVAGHADVQSATSDGVIVTILSVAGVVLEVTDPDLNSYQEYTVINAFSSSNQGVQMELPTIYCPNYYDGLAPEFSGFINLWDGANYLFVIPSLAKNVTTTIVPCIRSAWMLEYLFGLFGITISGDYLDHPEWSNRIEIAPRGIEREVFLADTSAGLDIDIPVSEFLPDITLSEWLLSIKSEACMSITFPSRTQTASLNLLRTVLDDLLYEDWDQYLVSTSGTEQEKYNGLKIGYTLDNNDIRIKDFVKKRKTFGEVKEPVANLTALFAITTDAENAVRLVTSKNAYYKWTLILGDSTFAWVFYSYNLDDYYELSETIDVRSVYCPVVDHLQMYDGDWNSTMLLPYMDVTGYFPQLGLNENSFAPRFSIYRGMQADIEANNYPMASINIYKADESVIVDSELIASPLSLASNFFSSWIELQQNKKSVVAFFDLPMNKIESLDPLKKIRIKSTNFLVTEFSGDIERKGLNLVQAKLIRIL
uniref:hypothetical protein n=1 Tax=Roseivirga sp. TaxID=1964215 RepID=UPI004047D7A4